MQKPYLIQRLLKPYKNKTKLDNPFSFGGGLINGGISNEAMTIIRDIFRFDYMGSVEFEYGAVPEALSKIYDNRKNFYAFESKCKTKEGNTATVYVLCDRHDALDIELWIQEKAKDEYTKLYYTKENVGLQDVINKKIDNLCGWLELDNGFMFFTDKEMFEKTKKMFEIE